MSKQEYEIWKDVDGYDGVYKISNYGRLISYYSGNDIISDYPRFKKGKVDKDGYIEYALSKHGKMKYYRAHRLVAQAFISNPENKPQVNHINGLKNDNRVDNLEWCSNSENAIHKYETGLGEKSRLMAKLTHGKKCKLISLKDNSIIMFNSFYEVDSHLNKYKGFTKGNYRKNINKHLFELGYRFELEEV